MPLNVDYNPVESSTPPPFYNLDSQSTPKVLSDGSSLPLYGRIWQGFGQIPFLPETRRSLAVPL